MFTWTGDIGDRQRRREPPPLRHNRGDLLLIHVYVIPLYPDARGAQRCPTSIPNTQGAKFSTPFTRKSRIPSCFFFLFCLFVLFCYYLPSIAEDETTSSTHKSANKSTVMAEGLVSTACPPNKPGRTARVKKQNPSVVRAVLQQR